MALRPSAEGMAAQARINVRTHFREPALTHRPVGEGRVIARRRRTLVLIPDLAVELSSLDQQGTGRNCCGPYFAPALGNDSAIFSNTRLDDTIKISDYLLSIARHPRCLSHERRDEKREKVSANHRGDHDTWPGRCGDRPTGAPTPDREPVTERRSLLRRILPP